MKKSKSAKAKSTKSKKPTAKRQAKAQPKPKAKAPAKPAVATTDNPDNPYRAGTMYATLFELGSQDYIERELLIRSVSEKCHKEPRLVSMGFSVLRARSHRSNLGRSALLVDDATGKVKFVKLQKSTT